MTDRGYSLYISVHDPGDGGPARTVVRGAGDVDAASATDFTNEVSAIPADGPLVLDLTGMSYLDSAGLAGVDAVVGRRPTVVVLAPESPVRRAADLVGLRYLDSVEQALTAG